VTLVNAETGELLAEMTPDEARQVTDRIRTALGVAWELVADAYQRRAWAAMGYPSWDAYTSAEFGAARLRLPREERQEVVASLRDAGLSIRAIAAATGHGVNTVQRDLAGVSDGYTSNPPEVEPLAAVPSGEAGGAPRPRPDIDSEDDVDVIQRLHEAAAKEAEKKITGTDGKSYPDTSRAAVAQRVGKAKAMAKEGYTSRQIANSLGLPVANFPDFKARHGIEVPADSTVGRARHLDSDRIVAETVSTLEGVVMGLDLVQMDGLAPDRIADWATSLSDSLRLLNRFQKQLKEMTQ